MILPLMQTFAGEPKKVLEYWYDNSMLSSWKKPPQEFVLDEAQMRADIAQRFNLLSKTVGSFVGKGT